MFLGFWVVCLGFSAQKPKNTRKSHRKLMSFWCLLDWILKMRGVITSALVFGWRLKCPLKIYFNAQRRGEGVTYPIKRESDSFFRDKLIPFWTICHTQKNSQLSQLTTQKSIFCYLEKSCLFLFCFLRNLTNRVETFSSQQQRPLCASLLGCTEVRWGCIER